MSYLADYIMNYFGDGKMGMCIKYFVEKELLGNVGALFKCNLKKDFLLLNADAVFDADFNRFVDYHKLWYESSRNSQA